MRKGALKICRSTASKVLARIHLLSIPVLCVLLVEAYHVIGSTNRALQTSIDQQKALRQIVWTNLLVQRAANLSLMAQKTGDESYRERAREVGESILDSDVPFLNESNHALAERLRTFSAHVVDIDSKQTPELAEKVGSDLNRLESHAWFELEDRNKKLFAGLERNRALLIFVLGGVVLLVGYLIFVVSRRERIALQLQAKSEELERQSQALASASKLSALGEMAGGIAHEINNPLATIQLRAAQVKDLLEEGETNIAIITESLDLIERTAGRIARIVKGLRTFSRDSGGDPFALSMIQAIVEDTLDLCREKFKNNQIRLDVSVPPSPLAFDCRAVQISQVMVNLLGNAFDAIEGRADKWVRLEVVDGGENLEFSVTDCGHGIPLAVREKIMQPFFTTKDIGKGTGLGLSISRGIVQEHGGTLVIDENCPNTRFVVSLPKRQKQERRSA